MLGTIVAQNEAESIGVWRQVDYDKALDLNPTNALVYGARGWTANPLPIR